MGDRFARQASAQLKACLLAAAGGAEVIPVWNKSNREHVTIGSEPGTTRAAADAAVKASEHILRNKAGTAGESMLLKGLGEVRSKLN